MVTSSGRGRENRTKPSPRLTAASLSSVTESIGISPRYSMRRPTSAAVGAAIDPLTTSPTWLKARYRNVGISSADGRDAQRFGDRGRAAATFADRVVNHRRHPGLRRGRVQRAGCGVRPDQVADFAGDVENLEHAATAAIADAAAALAALRAEH